ncbi:hypothetical protein Bbelb_201020 [Branchiostoma belcheri]|nr:hypothetical protein Bbelb_201020 [Branchiostoma belcheri]
MVPVVARRGESWCWGNRSPVPKRPISTTQTDLNDTLELEELQQKRKSSLKKSDGGPRFPKTGEMVHQQEEEDTEKACQVLSKEGDEGRRSPKPCERGGRYDLPVDSAVVWNAFRELLRQRYASTYRRLVSEACYGCLVDHPSQRNHFCLVMDDEDIKEFGRKTLSHMGFRTLYRDYFNLTACMVDAEEVPAPSSLHLEFEKWREEVWRSIESGGEESNGAGSCGNYYDPEKPDYVWPWIRDLIKEKEEEL